MCNIHKAHATPWTKSFGQATYSICYWDASITHLGILDNDDPVLYYYILWSNVNKVRFDTILTITACIHQLKNTRSQFKDVLKNTKSNGSFYQVEVATARLEKSVPHLTEGNAACATERKDKIELEIKACESRRNTDGYFRKLGRQICGHVKPNTANKSSLTRVVVPDDVPEGLWKQFIG
jgi:hypothetical protein